MAATQRELHIRRNTALQTERASWIAHYKEISEFLLPRAGRYFVEDRNRGERRHNNILDTTASRASRILSAGMMSGSTSPARPWFRIAVREDLMRYAPVKEWCAKVTTILLRVFSKSNTYDVFQQMYDELGAFGTTATIVQSDFQTVIHNQFLTTGEFCIAQNARGVVDTIYREFQMTVGGMVKEFGIDAVSDTVKRLHENGNLDSWVTVLHVVEPRIDRNPSKIDAKNMPWKSVYYEKGSTNADKPLRESGFRSFRGLAPRWDVRGGDIYGTSPGQEALGYIKQLQQEQLRKGQGIDYMTNPPLVVPSDYKAGSSRLPGGIMVSDAGATIRSAFEVRLDLNHLLADINDIRQGIRETFYADLFLMLANIPSSARMTATEVAERHEEKLIMLGPVMERLHREQLSPYISIAFEDAMAAGILPDPPEELLGEDINIDFISILAQAQRAVGVSGVDRMMGTIGSLAQFKPDVVDKLDADSIVDAYADMLGVDPSLIVPTGEVAIIRQQRADQQAAMQRSALMNQAADTTSMLSKAAGPDANPVDIMQSLSGYGGQV